MIKIITKRMGILAKVEMTVSGVVCQSERSISLLKVCIETVCQKCVLKQFAQSKRWNSLLRVGVGIACHLSLVFCRDHVSRRNGCG